MKRFLLLAALLGAACGGPRRGGAPARPASPPPEAVSEVKDPNFEAVVIETVPNADDEGVSFTKVFIDGKEEGKTEVGPRSQEKRVRLKVPAGNQPVRLEHWLLPPIGEWTRLPDEQQPRERFVRIEDGTIAQVTLRYGPNGDPSLTISRESR